MNEPKGAVCACPFRGCFRILPFGELLTHVQKDHGAIAWDAGTLSAAIAADK